MAAPSILQQQEQQIQKHNEASMQQLHQSSTLVVPKDEIPSESDGASFVSASVGSVKENGQPAYNLYPTTTSFGYYYPYPGYSGSFEGLDTQGYYNIGGNTMDVQYPIMQAENGSFYYMIPGYNPSYDPYSPCIPFNSIGVQGQYVGEQVYPSSSSSQAAIASNGYALPSSIPYFWDPSLLVGHGYTNFSTPNHSHDPNSKSDFTYPSFDVSSGHNSKLRPSNKASVNGPNLKSDLIPKGYFAVTQYPIYNNQRKSGLLYPNNLVSVKANGKLKNRSKASSVGDMNALSETSETKHGPGLTNASDELSFGCNDVTSLVKRDQYNLPDFEIEYDDAFFFVIKSYSEDDVHKSIKYNVWSSTAHGNKRLDSAYQKAQEKMKQRNSKSYPLFLFFSVNTSGQFCGLAEMTGRVDFEKNMGFWQQDKWTGYFPVKWHIIKDIPNSQLRHILLENNENKPVTNSRDTQEVKLNQGIEMLNIFKNYVTSTSILDDFDFYESRQKVQQEKRIKQSVPHYDLQQKVENLTTTFQSFNMSTMKHIDKGKE